MHNLEIAQPQSGKFCTVYCPVSAFEYTLNISQFAYCIMCSYTETGKSSIITQYCDTG